jgi:uncharacterized membrane protein
MKQILSRQLLSDMMAAHIAQWALTVGGMLLLVIVILKLPSLAMTQSQIILTVLLLIAVMQLCIVLGVLLVISEQIKQVSKH